MDGDAARRLIVEKEKEIVELREQSRRETESKVSSLSQYPLICRLSWRGRWSSSRCPKVKYGWSVSSVLGDGTNFQVTDMETRLDESKANLLACDASLNELRKDVEILSERLKEKEMCLNNSAQGYQTLQQGKGL